ncbi:MAG: DNA translocase FtsK [Chitinophagaceae bacterium]|nr:DNA translocase FtsK [Chitinophagaceae bacterium]
MAKAKVTTQTSKKNGKQKSKSENGSKSRFPMLKDGRMAKIVGVIIILLAIFSGVALTSYLFTWKLDQVGVFNSHDPFQYLFSNDLPVYNRAGRAGAWASHQLIYKGFGLAAFAWVFFLSVWGLNLLLPNRILPTLKTFFYTSLITLLLSPILAFFLPKEKIAFPFGGSLGNHIIASLYGFAGTIGTACIIIALVLVLFIIVFNPIFHLPFWKHLSNSNPANTDPVIPVPTATPSKKAKAETIEPELPELSELPPLPSLHIDTEIQKDTFDELIENEEQHHQPVELEPLPPLTTQTPEEIPLSLEDTAKPEPKVSKNTDDLTLEVVKPEEHHPEEIKKTPLTVASDEPYDPSLELRNYKFPTLDLLEQHGTEDISIDKNELEQNKNQIINTLKSFGITISKISATVGPTVTLYEIVPAEGVRISKIRNLEDDIALSLSALGIRIIAPIPGKGTIGIEVPNINKQIVSMRTLISSDKFIHNTYSLPIAIGKTINNENYIVDLATMPHLLMAGATGQGKSVGINTILVSLLYKKHPSQLKFVMVDPKKVELSIYKLIEKHFLAKLPNEDEAIITDTKKVINTLNALCIEMDNRYDLLKEAGVRNIKEYNDKFIKRKLNPNKGHQYLPFIVLVVDEFADLIMTAGKEVEMPIARLAQLARAVGIHLIIATQRPSVNVITGTIKANFPARVAFRVSAKVDSRTILDSGGAEQLIGRGDMLILNGSELVRLQCAFVDTPEVERIVEFIGQQQGYPTAFDLPEYEGSDGGDLANGGGSRSLKEVDQMFEQCARLVVTSGSGSTSMLQRRFNLGYNRAGRIMDQLEAAGIVGATTGGKPRELMIHTESELEEVLREILK